MTYGDEDVKAIKVMKRSIETQKRSMAGVQDDQGYIQGYICRHE